MFPSLLPPHVLYLPSLFVFGAMGVRMLPLSTVTTRSHFAFTHSNVAVYVLWRNEGATFALAAVKWVGGLDF